MQVTIKEVAKLVGVSPSTVSRVISDSPRISDETKKNVRKAMKELGYYPNAIARSLVSKETNTILIVMPQSAERAFLNPFFPLALSGISSAAHEADYCLLLSTGDTEKQQLSSIQEIVMSGRVDGVVLMFSSVDNGTLDFLKSLNIPSIVIGKPLKTKDILYVDNDNVEASYNVTMELIKKGHKKIGFISGPFNFVVSLDRLDGYRNALSKSDIPFKKEYIEESQFSKEGGYASMTKILGRSEKPTAMVVTDDIMAFGAMEAVKGLGLKIPLDMEFISFNNDPLDEFCRPSLSSVDIDAFKLGYESAKLIIEKIKGISTKNKVIVDTKIVYRESFIPII